MGSSVHNLFLAADKWVYNFTDSIWVYSIFTMAILKTVVLHGEHIWAMEFDFSRKGSTLDVYSVKTLVYFNWELNEN